MIKFKGLDKIKKKLQDIAEKTEWLEKTKHLLHPDSAPIETMIKEVAINDTEDALATQLQQIGQVIEAMIAINEQQTATLHDLKETILGLKKEFISIYQQNSQLGGTNNEE